MPYKIFLKSLSLVRLSLLDYTAVRQISKMKLVYYQNLNTRHDMLKIDYTKKTLDEVYEQFMGHPSGLIKKKLYDLCAY